MKFQEVELEKVMLEPARYMDVNILVKGLLAVRADKTTPYIEGATEETRLEISDRDFVDRLLDNVPCYVGGKFLYHDQVSIVARAGGGKHGPVLDEIVKVVFVRGGETFTI
ncbi:hypothetical protein IGB42_02857 [Andreprevotia sp. IGB-42]|uniref:hypothetical protein n=1 Tax=Andreprevotia sp. IGB-42 TaxID=2497473 RepID=UPI00135A6111|nr:hypothetical protein [Andreprevotia sp. IGB-42]KAF0812568.1 hypothetical protein IGB42_02857 [Andreprevotia sp. IGB-42]